MFDGACGSFLLYHTDPSRGEGDCLQAIVFGSLSQGLLVF